MTNRDSTRGITRGVMEAGEGRDGLSNVLHDIPKNEENEKLIKKQRRRERERFRIGYNT